MTNTTPNNAQASKHTPLYIREDSEGNLTRFHVWKDGHHVGIIRNKEVAALLDAATEMLSALELLKGIADTAASVLWNIDRAEALRFKADSKVAAKAISKAKGRTE